MIILRLALQSLRNRWITALLTVLAIAVSIVLLLGVEKVRTGARQSFADTISGTDLIVGEVDQIELSHGLFRIHQESEPEQGSENAVITVPAEIVTGKMLQPSFVAVSTAAAVAGLIVSRRVFYLALKSYRSASS